MADELESRPVAQNDLLLWREVDRLDKRIDETGRRLESLDQYGSRGVEALRQEVKQLRDDFLSHEHDHARATQNLKWAIGLIIGSVVALVGPIYPIILTFHR